MEQISCMKCKYYKSTYDPRSPRGCRFYGFETASIPSMVIKRETGSECMAYEKRANAREKKKELDLNDPKLW
ncbi:hypothetical protein HBN50_06535 [Halobacteriovorax sp. GB3]|uniref:hypothetical protein n=1 Tax=Halobacteriovorax sp. GB3 TaxID=2719615 RepID=UPI00236289B0|nr:hypothetical protein [Halobacteriovorax sp. GB3]MDD0852745.1 hypothetical protein [Halobacteriovorax sp. GB3]